MYSIAGFPQESTKRERGEGPTNRVLLFGMMCCWRHHTICARAGRLLPLWLASYVLLPKNTLYVEG